MRQPPRILAAFAGTLLIGCSGSSIHWSTTFVPADSPTAERLHEGDLPVPDTLARVDVDAPNGSIVIRADSGGPIRYIARVVTWAATAERAEALATAVVPHFSVDATTARVELDMPEDLVDAEEGLRVDWQLHVPPGLELRAATSAGDVDVTGPFNDCTLRSQFGDLAAKNGSGALDLGTASGSVSLISARDATSIELESQFGDVEAYDVDAESLSARTSSGDVTVRSTNFIRVLRAHSEFGDVAAEGCFQSVTARSNSGDVDIRAAIGSTCTTGWSAMTSFGDVTVEVPEDFAAEVVAATEYGSVKSSFQGVQQRRAHGNGDAWRGSLGEGGSTLTARSSTGNVTIRAGR